MRDAAHDIILRWRQAEWDAGLSDIIKGPDFGLSAALESWFDGQPLAKCAERVSAGEGDLVRWFRLMLQYARQVRKGLPDSESVLAGALTELVRRIDRDEVDARRQMELGEEDAAEAADEQPTSEAPGAKEDLADDDFGAGIA
jgi:hypothetical protein